MIEQTWPWRCVNGHVMGQVFRNGSNVRRLMLYQAALGLTPLTLPSPEGRGKEGEGKDEQGEISVIAIVEGFTTVSCTICGDKRAWVPGQEALKKLLKRMGR
jgi:hypothetical protein